MPPRIDLINAISSLRELAGEGIGSCYEWVWKLDSGRKEGQRTDIVEIKIKL